MVKTNFFDGITVQYDNSGVGHNYRTTKIDDIPADIVDELACEIDENKQDGEWHEYVGSNGCQYRWK